MKSNWMKALIIIVLILSAAFIIQKVTVQTEDNRINSPAEADPGTEDTVPLAENKAGSNWKTLNDAEELSAYMYSVAENRRFILCMKEDGEVAVWDRRAGHLYATNPLDKEEDTIAKAINKVNLGSQAYVEFVDQNGLTAAANTLGAAVNKGNVRYEPIERGVKFRYYFDTYDVTIAIAYTLEEDGLKVEFPFEDITEHLEEGKTAADKASVSYWGVMSVTLLPYFGAAGLDEEGYILLPDGSGALMYHNNNKAAYEAYSQAVYSREPALHMERNTNVGESIRMPVFGSKAGDNGFFGIITSGEASAFINAMTSGVITSYNTVYPRFIYRQVATAVTSVNNRYGTAGAIGANLITAIYPEDRSFAVKYSLLHEEGLNYADMAECYRNYLIAEKGLAKKASVTEAPLYLKLYGGLEVEKYILGFKTDYLQKLTSYKEAEEILQQLLELKVDQIVFQYTGWQKDGIESEIQSKVRFEKALGGYDDYQALVSFINDNNIKFFPDFDFVNFYQSGNGFSLFNDAVQAIQQTPAYQFEYDLNTLNKYGSSRWRLLTPVKAYEAFEALADNYDRMLAGNISLSTLGTTVYSDFTQKAAGIHRDDTLRLWERILKTAGDRYDNVMIDGGNIYGAVNASHIFGVTADSTEYDMADETVPFYQIVLHGYASYSTKPINLSADPDKELLKALETGSSLGFALMAGDPYEIVETKYNYLFSANYRDWLTTISEQYRKAAPILQYVSGKVITEHTMLLKNVYKTVYEDGSTVYVNYGKKAATADGLQVEAGDYVFIPGTEQEEK